MQILFEKIVIKSRNTPLKLLQKINRLFLRALTNPKIRHSASFDFSIIIHRKSYSSVGVQ